MMLSSGTELVAALRERLDIIGDESSRRNPEQHMERLRKISDRIEQIGNTLPQPINARLAHYLQRRSYDKALDLLCRGGL
jgi:hypothetical protein